MKKYRKANLVSISGLIALSLFFFYVSEKRVIFGEIPEEYVKIKGSKKSLKLDNVLCQNRKDVSKDLWINSGSSRVFCHLECPSSTLKFSNDEKKNTLTEELKLYKIWIQTLDNDNQASDLEYFRADKGDYNYRDQSLNSQKAFVSRIKKDASITNTFSFLANDLYISFKNFPLTFVASEFSAHLQSED
jgi:hypothetical protein